MGLREGTIKGVLSDTLELDAFFLSEGVKEPVITKSLIERWKTVCCANNAELTIYGKYSNLCQFCRYLCSVGEVAYIPVIPKMDLHKFTPYIYSHEQIVRIFSVADSYVLDDSINRVAFAMPAILRMLYSTGIRVGELCDIHNEDVYWDKHYLVLRRTKNAQERLVPLNDSLLRVLKQYLYYRNKLPIKGLQDPKASLFVTPLGKPIGSDVIYRNFRRILNDCEIPYFGKGSGPRIHDLRHTFAVHSMKKLIDQGVDIYCALPQLSAILGHKYVSSTEDYVRVTCEVFPEIIKMQDTLATIFPKTEQRHENN